MEKYKTNFFINYNCCGQISKDVEVLVLGSNISGVLENLKKTDIISKVNYCDEDFLKHQIAENLSEVIISF